MPMQPVSWSALSFIERVTATSLVLLAVRDLTVSRAQEVFRTLARGDALYLPAAGGATAGAQRSTLLREERVYAVSAHLALRVKLGEESADRVVAYLGNDGVYEALQRYAEVAANPGRLRRVPPASGGAAARSVGASDTPAGHDGGGQ